MEFNFIKVNEVKPIAYKSSVTPNSSTSTIDETISYNFSSVSVSGITKANLS